MSFKVKKRKFHFIIQSLILLLLTMFYFFNRISEPESVTQWSEIVTSMLAITVVFQIFWMKKLEVKIFEFEFWFMILTYLFMFGRVILHALSLDGDIFWNLMIRYKKEVLFNTGIFLILSTQILFISLMMSRKIKSENSFPRSILTYTVGKIMFIISFPFKLMEDYYNIYNAQIAGGYGTLDGRVGLIDDIAFLAIPSIILIIASKKFDKKQATVLMTLTTAYLVVLMAISGDRRYSVTGLIALLLCYLRAYNIELNFKKTIISAYLTMIFLNLLVVIREVRVDNLTSISVFITDNANSIFFDKAFIVQTLEEFGLSFFSVVNMFEYIPTLIPFQNGLPLLYTIPSILPVGWLLGDLFSKTSISAMTNGVLNVPVGSSLFGDFYGNFGWYGLVGLFVAGYFLGKIMGEKITTSYGLGIYYSKFYILINLVRAEIFEVYRPLLMVVFVPFIIRKFVEFYIGSSKSSTSFKPGGYKE